MFDAFVKRWNRENRLREVATLQEDSEAGSKLQRVARMARELIGRNGLSEWSFSFDHAKRRYGCCHFRKRRITLSWRLVLLNSLEESKETILHEIAHALSRRPGHGPEWRRIARSLGCTPTPRHNAITPPPNFIGVCPTCLKQYPRYRRPPRQSRHYCRPCSRKLGPIDAAQIRWMDRQV